MKKILSFLLLLLVLPLLLSVNACKKDNNDDNNDDNNNNEPTTVTDAGGNVYNIVKIGNQYWTKENLKYNITGSSCYENNTTHCNTYGRLYKHAAAMTACPSGWHLPSDAEWKTLEMYLGMSQAEADEEGWDRGTDEGTKLKEGGSSGFNGKLGGFGNTLNQYNDITYGGYFWSSTTAQQTYDAWNREITQGAKVKRPFNNKENSFSVRCVKN